MIRVLRSVRFLRLACLAMALVWMCASFAAAQTQTTGAISGTITDSTGAVIPGATITATSATSGIVLTAQSQGNGHYIIPQLKPGEYTVLVKRTGFQSIKQGPIAVSVASNTNLGFKLSVGESSQTVEVTGAAPLLQPENPNISTTLNTTAIANLPNPGNDLTFLA